MSTAVRDVTVYYPRALHGDGGVTNSLWLWVESLRRAGLGVTVLHDAHLAPHPDREIHPAVETRPVRHVGYGRARVPLGLKRHLQPGSALLLHSGYVSFNLVAAAAARRRGVPYVIVPHGAYAPDVREGKRLSRPVWEVAERRMLERALAVHVFFLPEVEHVRAVAPRARDVVSPTAFELPTTAWDGGEDEPYVAWVGRYDVHHKGLDRLLDAMALLQEHERPMLRLHGRDSKDSRDTVQRLVDLRGLREHVRVGGPVDERDKQALLLAAAAYVLPSRWESYGVALVEALALGVPCLTTTEVNLAPALVVDRSAAVVGASTAELAQGLRAAAAGELREYGGRGRDFVSQRLSHAAAAHQLLRGLHPADEVLA